MLVRRMVRKLASNLMHLIPSEVRYEVCRHHANKEFAENRSNFRTNGELWLLRNLLPQMCVALDIGANTGEWASLALSINPQVRLHCFEPVTKVYGELLRRRFPSTVVCNPFGLGDRAAEQTVYVYEGISEGNSLHLCEGDLGRGSQTGTQTAKIDTLDNYCSGNDLDAVDFAKIDVEGHEFAVIKGAENLLREGRLKVVQFEYGPAYIDARVLLKDLFDFFRGLEYRFMLLYPDHLRLIPRYDKRLENFHYKNFVVAHEQFSAELRPILREG